MKLHKLSLFFPKGYPNDSNVKLKLDGNDLIVNALDVRMRPDELVTATIVLDVELNARFNGVDVDFIEKREKISWYKRLRRKLIDIWYNERW